MNRRRFAQTMIGAALITATGMTAGSAQGEVPGPALVKTASAEDTYVATMRALDAGYFDAPMSDADYIRGGRGFCDNELKNGLTWSSLRQHLEDEGLGDYYRYFRTSVQAAATSFCPQYLPIRQG